jgi:hypothetical protein
MLFLIFFYLFALFMSMHFKPQKLDIVLKKIECDLSSASTIRYRRAEVLAKVLLSIVIFCINSLLRHSKANRSKIEKRPLNIIIFVFDGED